MAWGQEGRRLISGLMCWQARQACVQANRSVRHACVGEAAAVTLNTTDISKLTIMCVTLLPLPWDDVANTPPRVSPCHHGSPKRGVDRCAASAASYRFLSVICACTFICFDAWSMLSTLFIFSSISLGKRQQGGVT